MTEHLLTSAEVAEILQVRVATLANWRSDGKGPEYVRLGTKAIRYRPSAIEHWLHRGDSSTTRTASISKVRGR